MTVATQSAEGLLLNHAEQLRSLGVEKIGLFGSIVRADFGPESDVDVYVEFDPAKKNYDNFYELHELLRRIFDRSIDLVTDKSLSKHFAPRILSTIHYVDVGN